MRRYPGRDSPSAKDAAWQLGPSRFVAQQQRANCRQRRKIATLSWSVSWRHCETAAVRPVRCSSSMPMSGCCGSRGGCCGSIRSCGGGRRPMMYDKTRCCGCTARSPRWRWSRPDTFSTWPARRFAGSSSTSSATTSAPRAWRPTTTPTIAQPTRWGLRSIATGSRRISPPGPPFTRPASVCRMLSGRWSHSSTIRGSRSRRPPTCSACRCGQ